jgi:hypothetical protein
MKMTYADDLVMNELARLRADLEANQERLSPDYSPSSTSQRRPG